MDAREELEALRRMAELEAKAGGVAPATPADQASQYIKDQRKQRITQAQASGGQAAQSLGRDIAMALPNLAAGAVRGAGSIGSTLAAPFDMASDAMAGKGLSLESNRQRRAGIDQGLRDLGANPDSFFYGAGKLGGEVAGTLGVGPALAGGARAVGAAPALTNAIGSAGMRTMSPAAASVSAQGAAASAPMAARLADMATRIGGGAITGGASAGLVDPSNAGIGAAIGGALPPVLAGLGSAGSYLGGVAGSLTRPLTKQGQERMAADIIKKFGEGGPLTLDTREIIKGSTPTLAESTGNAGIAGLQRAARDLRPNAFVEREAAQSAARTAAFDEVAGDVGKLDFYKQSRAFAGKELYDAALNRAPETPTPYVKGQVTQLLKRPSIDEASRVAQKWALERGEKPYMEGSLRGLHDVKTALDDKIADAVMKNQGGEAKALGATQQKLLGVMEKLSPEYKEARLTYAAMSKPVNEMEALQGLRLTDARGNITLAKLQNAIHGIEKQRAAPGVNNAKAIDEDKLQTLYAIRDDLLRQGLTQSGRSAGSNTFQNLATDNILGSMLPGKVGKAAIGKVGSTVGQVGKLVYSGADQKIRNNMVDMMLDPSRFQAATAAQQPQTGMIGAAAAKQLKDLLEAAYPGMYRAAPILATGQ